MYKAERIRMIQSILTEKEQVDVATLSMMLDVTEATIRTDLEQLEKSGFLTRYHGGATLNPSQASPSQLHHIADNIHIPFDKEKETLADVAAQLINEREWVFIGPGTTGYYLAKALAKRNNINILTNSFYVSNVLSSNLSIRMIFLGGNIQNEGMYTVPNNINRDLEQIYLSKAFFSVDAVSLDAGYTLTDIYILDIIKTICNYCGESIVCLDSKKFDQRSFMSLGDLSFASSVVTDQKPSTEYETYYKQHGINLYTP